MEIRMMVQICMLLAAGVPGMLPGAMPATQPIQIRHVGQWDRFEATIENSRGYADPYRDVTLEVVYTRPDGGKIRFWGFYDGGSQWKIRFMPDRLGLWRYAAGFSDGAPGIRGGFECTPSTIPGLISNDETNPRWFGFRGGRHVLIRSFHAVPLFSDTLDEFSRRDFLDWAARQGYNTLSSGSHFSGKGAPRLWPLDAPSFRRIEAVLDELSNRRMMIFGFAGFFGGMAPMFPADEELYIKYCMARFGPYWNEIFNVGGPELDKTLPQETINRLGALIHKYDVFGHLLGVHQLGNRDDAFRDAAWSSTVTLQIKVPDVMELNQWLIRNQPGSKPVYGQEDCWQGNTIQFAKRGGCHPDRFRQQMWTHLLSASAINVGDMNGNNATGFSGSLKLSDRIQSRHDVPKMIWDYFQSTPYYRMSPHPELVDRGICLA